jgi:hypothetical protein
MPLLEKFVANLPNCHGKKKLPLLPKQFIVKQICVFCGSSMGRNEVYRQVAFALGKQIALNGFELVYGGANVGLMKVLAESVMAHGGMVTGVMPHLLIQKEVAHTAIQRMCKVNSMAERKELMVEISDAFIAMPGGFGTLDELAEILTLNQLRIIDKPLGLLNTNGFFDPLLQFLDLGVKEGFVRAEHRNNILVSEDAEELLTLLQVYQPVEIGKWISEIKKESE